MKHPLRSIRMLNSAIADAFMPAEGRGTFAATEYGSWFSVSLAICFTFMMVGCHGTQLALIPISAANVSGTVTDQATSAQADLADLENSHLPADHSIRALLTLEMSGTTQWQAVELWPEPIAGPTAILELPAGSFRQWAATNQAEWKQLGGITHARQEVESDPLTALRILANEESLAGWNALIMLTQFDQPVTVTEQQKLEQLVWNPPEYSSKDGYRWQTPVSEESPPLSPSIAANSVKSNWQELGSFWKTPFPKSATDISEKSSGTNDETSEQTKGLSKYNQDPEAKKLPLSLEMRAAAAEGLIRVLAKQHGPATARYAAIGQSLIKADLPVKLQATLIRGIAKEISPRLIPGVVATLADGVHQSEPDELTLACLDACLIYALSQPDQARQKSQSPPTWGRTVHQAELDPEQLWPEPIWQYRWAEQVEVVNRFGLWLAVIQHPLAESYLKQALQHVEPETQWNAIRSLGLISSPERKSELLQWAEAHHGLPRAVAIVAAAADDPEIVYAYSTDSSAQVRSRVAMMAGRHPAARTQQLLISLAKDADLAVQSAALQAIETWKPEQAFPVLSSAFVAGAPATRKQARLLMEKQHQVVLAHLEDTPEDRQLMMNSLQETLAVTDMVETAPLPDQSKQSVSEKALRPELLVQFQDLLQKRNQPEISAHLQQELDEQLRQLWQQTPELLSQELERQSASVVEQRIWLFASQGEELCRELHRLNDPDLSLRRKGARELADRAEKQTLPGWALQYLADRLPAEQDVHVCRGILQAIADDTSPAARRIIEQSLIHTWPDVRVLGCQYSARHRLPQLAPFLVPLLHSRNLTVQQAAIQAAGRCRNPVVINGFPQNSAINSEPTANGGLKSLLGSGSSETEWLVIAALAELGDDQGLQELRKLCYSPVTDRRIAAIEKLTALRDEHAVAIFIRIAWTEQHTKTRQTILNSLAELVPVEKQPPLSQAVSLEEQISVWTNWLDQQGAAGQARP